MSLKVTPGYHRCLGMGATLGLWRLRRANRLLPLSGRRHLKLTETKLLPEHENRPNPLQ